jgi:phosphomevalonate kinase
MSVIEASAPGKVFIAGEFAVLGGAPAICMAVNRHAHVTITRGHSDYHSVLAPGHSQALGRFTDANGKLEWLEGSTDFSLLVSVWEELAVKPRKHLAIVLDSNELIDVAARKKLGIGSSAALTVALTAALDAAAGGGNNVQRIAAKAHRRLQDGAGSGADIACSLNGGLIEYRMIDGLHESLNWPEELYYAHLWSGVTAYTGEQLAKLGSVTESATRTQLVEAASDVAHAWHAESTTDIVDTLRKYAGTLRNFDLEHNLGIYDAGHAELADIADSFGVIYKPCGAGGGDLGIAISSDDTAVATFAAAATAYGFKHLRMSIASGGVSCDGEKL